MPGSKVLLSSLPHYLDVRLTKSDKAVTNAYCQAERHHINCQDIRVS